MSQITTIVHGADEAFGRPVLFQSAGQWVEDALAQAALETAASLDAVQTDHVLLIGAPCPELTAQDYLALVRTHLAVGADFTLFSDARALPPRGVEDEILSLPAGTVPVVCARTAAARALDSSCGLVEAVDRAVRAGASAQDVRRDGVIVVTDGASAFMAQKKLCEQINMGHIARGVQIFAPDSVYIAPDAKIGAGTVILPGTIIRAGCEIGCGATIGPNTLLEKAKVGDGTSVNSSQIYESSVGAEATVGPFAYIRPGCTVGDHTRIGDFVELKKAEIGNGTKVSHLTYIGDATVGERVNFGCGTVVVNYDGYQKTHTYIGDDCFIGCNTNLVSPVRLGDRAFTAAGSTITHDISAGSLGVARARQTTLEGWNDRRRARMEKK